MDDERVYFEFLIGIDKELAAGGRYDSAIAEIDEAITRAAGGMTKALAEGTWTKGAQDGDFSGPVEHDLSCQYCVITTPEEAQEVYGRVKQAIYRAAKKHDLPVEHVHVTRHDCRAAHFAISEMDG